MSIDNLLAVWASIPPLSRPFLVMVPIGLVLLVFLNRTPSVRADGPRPRVARWATRQDLHRSRPPDRGEIFSILKDKLTAYLLETKGRRAALVIDEAVTVTRQQLGEDALYDLTTRGRHYGIEVHTLTQLATTWFNTEIGRAVQGTSANQWFGQMEDRERDEMTNNGVRLSPEELELNGDRAAGGCRRDCWQPAHSRT
jgi:hypothetical protein